MKTFAYKQQKSVTFGLISKEGNPFVKEKKNNFKIKYREQEINFNCDAKDRIYGDNLWWLQRIFHYMQNILHMIFAKEPYHRFTFSYEFTLVERKKLQTRRIAEKALKDKIWRKYEKQFQKLLNNISLFDEILEEKEDNFSKISHIVRIIRYINWDTQKLGHCISNYTYFWDKIEKKSALEDFKNFIQKNWDFWELLEFYSKLDKEQFEEYKIALNPAILNTHSEVNQQNWTQELDNLKMSLEALERKNNFNKNTKRFFEEDLEAYINYILYQKNFFKQSKNVEYKKNTQRIYEKYSNLSSNARYPEELVIDFIEGNEIDLENPYKVAQEELDKYLQQQESINSLKNLKSNINFVQLKTFLYQLTWKRAEIKENNKKSEEKLDYQKLSEYIVIIKWEINSRLKNTNYRYWEFIKSGGIKAQTAQKLWQKYGEYMQKLNFDKELKGYTHFWFIVKKWKRFFIKPYKKQDILNENQGFTLQNAENLLKEKVDVKWEYAAFLFQSLTLKWLLKLIFIKNAFNLDFREEYKIYQIWKQKKYIKDKFQSTKLIDFLIKILASNKWKELFPYVDNDFKKGDQYSKFQEFEKDLLKNSYKVKKYQCNFDENELIELDIVDRKFEHNDAVEPRLKRQNDIQILVEWFFGKQNFSFIRLLPEIKIFVRYQKLFNDMEKRVVSWIDSNWDRYEKEINEKERFYKTISKASFMLELNPCEIGGNPQKEKKEYQDYIIDLYQKRKDFHIISIDIGENSFATLGVYNSDLAPQKINVKWLPQQNENQNKDIIDITDLKIEKWEIVQINTKNSEKYKSYKNMFENILRSQIYLKDILEQVGEIDLKNENYNNIAKKIGESINRISELRFNTCNIIDEVKQAFPLLKNGLKQFLFSYIKSLHNGQDKAINITQYYHQIFEKLELQKVINFKDAFWANFVGVMKEILNRYPGIIVFESLHTGNNYDSYNDVIKKRPQNTTSEKSKEFRTFGTYIWMYIVQSLVNSFSKIIDIKNEKVNQLIYWEKNYETTIWKEKYSNNGILFFVDEKNTSSVCPICNWNFIQKIEKNWEVIEQENKNIKKLFGHWRWKEFENSMHHINDENDENYQKWKWKSGNLEKGDCDYHIGNKNYPEFEFIKSWDDLATYNIAKKAKEYLESLQKKEDSE